MRDDILRLSPEDMSDVATFCNTYPNIEVEYSIVDESDVETGDAVQMIVTLEREVDEDEDEDPAMIGQVHAPRFPTKKTEGWWLVIGDKKRNSLLCVKRVVIPEKAKMKLDFVAPDEAGDYALTLYLMCDSYIGCDQEYEFSLSVAQGESDDDDDEEEDEEDGES